MDKRAQEKLGDKAPKGPAPPSLVSSSSSASAAVASTGHQAQARALLSYTEQLLEHTARLPLDTVPLAPYDSCICKMAKKLSRFLNVRDIVQQDKSGVLYHMKAGALISAKACRYVRISYC